MAGPSTFTVAQARSLLPVVLETARELIPLRAELAAAAAAHRAGDTSEPLADVKAREARLSELLDGLSARGIQVKGWAPLLVDFPMSTPHGDVLLCWLEGETELGWYHPVEQGFAGRRPIADLEGEPGSA